eukprot:1582037-Prymnesium_polylepis.1
MKRMREAEGEERHRSRYPARDEHKVSSGDGPRARPAARARGGAIRDGWARLDGVLASRRGEVGAMGAGS